MSPFDIYGCIYWDRDRMPVSFDTFSMYLYGFEHGIGIYGFCPKRTLPNLRFLEAENNFYYNLFTVLGSTAPSPFMQQIVFGLVSLFNDISIFVGYLMPSRKKKQQLLYYLTHSRRDKVVYTFPKGICPKINVTAQLEFEFANFDSSVQRFNHYFTRTPL